MVLILVLLLFNILSIFLKGKLLFLYFGSNVMNCNIPLRSDCRIPQLASHVSFLAASLHYSTIRIITSENDRKPKFDTRSTMKNWTSYVPNTVFSLDHEGLALASLEVRRNLSARTSFRRTLRLARPE